MVPTIKKNIIISFNVLTIAFFKKLPCHISFEIFIYILYAIVNNKLLNKE